MTPTLPAIIGHRGAKALAPENTIAGIEKAAALGVTWVEFDVKLTRDGVPVLMHDPTLDRTTSGRGRVADHDWAAIRALGVPSLDDTMAALERLGMGANVEIKPCPGRIVETARVVTDRLRAAWPKRLPPPLVSSFERAALEVAAERAPELPRGFLAEKLPADWRDAVAALGCVTVHLGDRWLAPDDAAAVVAAGLPLVMWTVNTQARADALRAMGAVSIITDDPTAVA